MGRKPITDKTCYILGFVGAGITLVAGVLMALGFGAVSYFRMTGFALTGGMLLFLASGRRGTDNKSLRWKLMLLFLLLVVSYVNLPPLNYVCEGLVLPLMFLLLGKKEDRLPLVTLGGAELVYLAARTLAITPQVFGEFSLQAVGLATLLVSAARFWTLFVLYRRAAAAPPPPEDPDVMHRLR